jgi:regulator of cell morphogenesis and NO signaling
MDKVTAVHGLRHPELAGVAAAFAALRDDLEPHLVKEERVLFPMVRALTGDTTRPRTRSGSVREPIAVMLAEHDRAGELLALLRERTGGHTAPEDGCARYRALYRGLAELEADTHLHVHKENHRLFPAVIASEQLPV